MTETTTPPATTPEPNRAQTLTRLYLAAALTGGLAGLLGAAFHYLLDLAEGWRSWLQPSLSDLPVPGWALAMGAGALVLTLALWLVRRFAPEAAGSGVQEVEAILAGERGLRWQRVLPVKFVAGTLAVGSGLVLGREGPTIHIGSAVAAMAARLARLDVRRTRALIAAGAGAGLAAAFNAPLSGIIFVTEELREHFEYRLHSLQAVILACCLAVVVCEWMFGQGPALRVENLATPALTSVPLFLVLGIVMGAFGALFNRMLLGSMARLAALRERIGYGMPILAGALLGALVWFYPLATGGGEALVESLLATHPGFSALLLLLVIRTLTSVGSYGIGLPGGIFAPLLALGTTIGVAFDAGVSAWLPALAPPDGTFAVAAMGALFAATVRAPLTGIVLAIELTGAHGLTLPIILTCLTATFAAVALGGQPIYSLLLARSRQPPATPRRWWLGLLAAAGLLGALIWFGHTGAG